MKDPRGDKDALTVELIDGTVLRRRPECDAANDFTDIDAFGESLCFDENGERIPKQ